MTVLEIEERVNKQNGVTIVNKTTMPEQAET